VNERIKELAEQAGMTRILDEHAHEYGNGTFEDTPYPAMDKFVELIVNECVGIVEGGRFLHDEAPAAIFARECSTAIKRHFGVE
jgi:hypothetical protein